ncbi:uncharacterized protein BXIN_0089 [Babesia sp. Xinjiang]|uniref:uncharacterized protein n=1 Tax=Babesia sp. Xinjiang TaxID=462227 RepID=UPI000A22654C|nr:uncharacterized protein BXIN_0089 [Babesia sp. Xinjiang]ORM39619.1 hypothetical protein BXIN_0089 [Babesia sp. Xinjiang]
MAIVEDIEVTSPNQQTAKDGATDSHISAKVRGAELFKKGDIDGAIDAWFSGLRALEFILDKKGELKRDSTSNEDFLEKWKIFVNTYVDLSSNMSLALLKKGDYRGCVKYCQQALKYDKSNLKAFLRITQAHAELGQFGKALEYCNEGINLNPENVELKILKKKVLTQSKAQDESQKLVMQKIFKTMEHDPRSVDGPRESIMSKVLWKTAKGLWVVLSPVLRFTFRFLKVVFEKHVLTQFR